MRAELIAGLAASLLVGSATLALSAAPTGYLAPGSFDILEILPPAPVEGDARYEADRRVFRETRSLLGGPRGAMALGDVDRRPAAMLHDFSCALGAELAPDRVRRTVRAIERATIDAVGQMNRAKQYYRRLRPLMIDAGPACQPREHLAKSFDYPSGHTTGGWTWALILAELAPDRATGLLARGRAFGQSRAICGAHNASAVEAGFLTAATTLTAIRSVPAYRSDLEAARRELAQARRQAEAPDPARCAAERSLVSQKVY
jgi:acid phosphatase (class A)